MIISTSRLYLRRFQASDDKDFFLLNSDQDVIRYTGDSPFENITAANLFLRNYNHYEQYGYGRWAVINKIQNQFIGWCGLKYSSELDEVDIGFRFFKKFWNQGFATEAAAASLHYGFDHLGLEQIVGRAMKANTASVRVLEKLGMRYLEDRIMDGEPGVVYIASSDLRNRPV